MEFIKPVEIYLEEYLAACGEACNHNVTEWRPVEPDDFEGFRKRALGVYEMLERGEGLPEGIPRMITYWCIENDRFIGEVQIRPCLSAEEAKSVGHIGYAVRYSMWGKGFGTRLLRFAVERLREYQVTPIYIACHVDNIGSNRVSQKVGFTFVEQKNAEGQMENLYVLR